jgi:nucleotide-binding universal stress UspA family protein
MKILVGVDLSVQGHDWLLQRATIVARKVHGEVDLVYVATPSTPEHHALLGGLLTLLPEDVRGRARVESGDPADTLVALTPDYGLMIIGPREPNALQRWLVGPMAVRVLKRSSCPVLVPRREAALPEAPRMLAGIDVRGIGVDQVLAFGIQWTELLGGRLDAVFAAAAHLPAIRNKEVREKAQAEFMASLNLERTELAATMERVPESLRGEGRIEQGEPEDVLVRLSGAYDLLLVGNRGRTGLTRLLMGDVANHVVRAARCDVLVLPTAALTDSI